mgnify:CR=1 FL=1
MLRSLKSERSKYQTLHQGCVRRVDCVLYEKGREDKEVVLVENAVFSKRCSFNE